MASDLLVKDFVQGSSATILITAATLYCSHYCVLVSEAAGITTGTRGLVALCKSQVHVRNDSDFDNLEL